MYRNRFISLFARVTVSRTSRNKKALIGQVSYCMMYTTGKTTQRRLVLMALQMSTYVHLGSLAHA